MSILTFVSKPLSACMCEWLHTTLIVQAKICLVSPGFVVLIVFKNVHHEHHELYLYI